MRVLIVEDEEMLRKAYATILRHEGYHVDEAANGNEALTRIQLHMPDLILLDILMPEADGLSFLERAELNKRAPSTRVITFSNLSDQSKLEKMSRLGATEHILKSSLSPKQLADTVRRMLTNS